MIPFEFVEPIRTERLTLRLMTLDDVDDVHAYQSLESVCQYMLYAPRSREEVAQRIAVNSAATRLEKDGDYLQLAMEYAQPDARPRVIGDLYFSIQSLEHSRADIGWTLHPDFHRRGLASEGATAVLRFAFETLGLHRVIAELDPRNDASIALCRRLGMRHEAHFVKDMLVKGSWDDTGVFAILDEEWASRA